MRLVNLENEAVQANRNRAQRNSRWQQPNNVSSSYPQETVQPARQQEPSTRTLGKPKSFTGQTAEWTTWHFTFKAFAFAAHPKMKEVFDPCHTERLRVCDMTAELQSPSTQLYCMLVMVLSDQALEIVRNSPVGNGAEVWRKLLSE